VDSISNPIYFAMTLLRWSFPMLKVPFKKITGNLLATLLFTII